jgi:LacI family transcriptional regulator
VPRLATIQQDTSGLARKSVEDLLMRINYQNRTANHEMIPFRVLTGESIKKK